MKKKDNFLGATRVFAKKTGYKLGCTCKYCRFDENDMACAKVNCRESLTLPSGTIFLNYIWINKKDRTI